MHWTSCWGHTSGRATKIGSFCALKTGNNSNQAGFKVNVGRAICSMSAAPGYITSSRNRRGLVEVAISVMNVTWVTPHDFEPRVTSRV